MIATVIAGLVHFVQIVASVLGILALSIFIVAYHARRAPVLEPEELAPIPPVRPIAAPRHSLNGPRRL